MDYEGQICRSPMERGSFMLPVSVGCSYGKCKFCTLFRHLHYRTLPLAQIEQELRRVQQLGGSPKQVFLGDGNAFALPFEQLIAILERIHHYFPDCERVNMDATVASIAQKSDEELQLLRRAGVHCLYMGIETGLDDVLRFMNKGHTVSEALRQIERLHRAGCAYSAHIMTGVAGTGRGLESAEATAAFFNDTAPESITNFSLFLSRWAPLYQDILSGAFHPASETENLEEAWHLLQLLRCGTRYEGFHDMLSLRVHGALPKDRAAMLQRLTQALLQQEKAPPLYAFVE